MKSLCCNAEVIGWVGEGWRPRIARAACDKCLVTVAVDALPAGTRLEFADFRQFLGQDFQEFVGPPGMTRTVWCPSSRKIITAEPADLGNPESRRLRIGHKTLSLLAESMGVDPNEVE